MEALPTDPDKLAAALELLEAEKQRRLQAKIDAGELVVLRVEGSSASDPTAVKICQRMHRICSFPLPGAHTISNTFVEVLRAHCSL